MRYLLKSEKKAVKIVRESRDVAKRKVRRERFGLIISSGLLSAVLTIAFTRHEVNMANIEAEKGRQRAAFSEVWAAAELHALEVSRMHRVSGLYLLAEKLQKANGRNPIAEIFVSERRAQNKAIASALRQAEAKLATNQLQLDGQQRQLMRSYLVVNQEIVRELLSLDRRESTNFQTDDLRLKTILLEAGRLKSDAETLVKRSN